MAGYNRGDDELDDLQDFALDGENEETEGTNILMVVVVSLLFLVAFGCVVWVAYNNGVAHGRDQALNQKPASYDVADTRADTTSGDASNAGTVARLVAQSMQKNSEKNAAVPAQGAPVKTSQGVAPEKAVPEKKVSAAPEKIQQRAVAKPEQKPAPKAAPKAEVKAAPRALAKPVVKKTAVRPETKPEVKSAPAAASSGAYTLQIGAFPSVKEAESAWKKFQHKHSGLLSGAPHNIQKAVLKKGTWYRLRAGAFATKADASALCAKLKAQGGACFPAR